MLANAFILNIGGDVSFELSPELVHAVEFRPLLGEPDLPDVQRLGQPLTCGGGMARGLIEYQRDGAAGIRAAQQAQEVLKVLLPHARPAGCEAVASSQVEGAKEHALGVLPRDRDASLLPAQGPGSAQFGQQPEHGFVLKEPHRIGGQALQLPHNGRLFFAPRWEPSGSRNSAVAYTPGRSVSSVGVRPKARWRCRNAHSDGGRGLPPSIRWCDNPVSKASDVTPGVFGLWSIRELRVGGPYGAGRPNPPAGGSADSASASNRPPGDSAQ